MIFKDGIQTSNNQNSKIKSCIYCGVGSKNINEILISGKSYTCCNQCKDKAERDIKERLNRQTDKMMINGSN